MVAVRSVAGSGYAEVLHIRHVAFGDRFVECQADFIVHAQHTVCRLDVAEDDRAFRILHPGDDGRFLRHELVAYLREGHGTDVVVLVLGPEEAGGDGRTGDKFFCARCFFVVGRVGEEATDVRPARVRLRRCLVLHLNMVESLEVHVEPVDCQRHIVFVSRIFRRVGIQCPLVCRAFDVDV